MTTRSIPWPRILAEGFAIVVSILLAFGIQAWWEGVQRQQEERTLLRELQATLSEDLQTVTQEADTLRGVNDRLGSLIQRLEAGAGMDSVEPDYQEDFWGLHRFLALNVRFGPYETLKTRGLDLVSDRDLRVRLTSLYEDSFPYLIENSEIDQRLVRDRIVPFMFEHLELDANGNWVEREGTTEARSLGLSLARYRQQTLVVFYIPSFTATISLIQDTLAAIEDYLDG